MAPWHSDSQLRVQCTDPFGQLCFACLFVSDWSRGIARTATLRWGSLQQHAVSPQPRSNGFAASSIPHCFAAESSKTSGSGFPCMQVAMRSFAFLIGAAWALIGAVAAWDKGEPACTGDPDCPENQWCLEDKTCGVPPWKCGMLGLQCCNGKCAISNLA
jgi:hypothetical protein